jgi:hypothetical protein
MSSRTLFRPKLSLLPSLLPLPFKLHGADLEEAEGAPGAEENLPDQDGPAGPELE